MADTAVAKRGTASMMNHPVVEGVKAGLRPVSLAANVGIVGGGAVGALAGGALARKLIDPVENFANGGPWQEALVDFGAGLPLVAVGVGVAYKLKGTDMALRVGGLAVAGNAIGAVAAPAVPHIVDAIDRVTDFIAGLIGKKAKAASQDGETPAVKNVNAPPPAGLYEHVDARRVGGGLYTVVEPGGRSGRQGRFRVSTAFPGAAM